MTAESMSTIHSRRRIARHRASAAVSETAVSGTVVSDGRTAAARAECAEFRFSFSFPPPGDLATAVIAVPLAFFPEEVVFDGE
ncbi:hypothetical protein OG352_33320 [Streptomyces sp. NBC_01485]|uniref:hypothetical protein n=1 Tax=Streptomyces sp. NBC_01485 TaxID=2903884 RepID=UPI002E2F567E|nr:hypothetical protein [Streptomyces sp. NBC_01485]